MRCPLFPKGPPPPPPIGGRSGIRFLFTESRLWRYAHPRQITNGWGSFLRAFAWSQGRGAEYAPLPPVRGIPQRRTVGSYEGPNVLHFPFPIFRISPLCVCVLYLPSCIYSLYLAYSPNRLFCQINDLLRLFINFVYFTWPALSSDVRVGYLPIPPGALSVNQLESHVSYPVAAHSFAGKEKEKRNR